MGPSMVTSAHGFVAGLRTSGSLPGWVRCVMHVGFHG